MGVGTRLRAASRGGTLRVEGLAQLQRDLGRVSKDARKEVREGLKDVGKLVADDAQIIARARGLRKTGDLIRKTVPTVRQQGVFVEAKAMHRGYRYPGIYEYGRGGRPFLTPALVRNTERVERRMETWLDTFLSHNGF